MDLDVPSPVKGQRLYGKLVIETLKQRGSITFDQNIRKRVYDVINVISAMKMAYKDGKNILWSGEEPEEFSQKKVKFEKEKQKLEESVGQKEKQLQDLQLQLSAYKLLLLTKREKPDEHQARIHLPFVVVKVKKDAEVKCKISSDKMQHIFTFDQPFEILDNMQVIQAMGLAFGMEENDCCTEASSSSDT